MDKIEYLPLGSVVAINGGIEKYVIVARGIQVKIENEPIYFDYGACQYPIGMVGDQLVYFQHENIKKIYFHGFSDDTDKLMVDNINEQVIKNKIERVDIEALKQRGIL